MATTIRRHTPSLFAAAALAFGLQGCAVEIDPFGRSYAGGRAMEPGRPICDRVPKGTTRPRLIRGNRPVFPLPNRSDDKKGATTIDYEVSAAGKVTVLSTKSLGPGYWASHVVLAVEDWKVEPATRDGVPVPVQCTMKFVYDVY